MKSVESSVKCNPVGNLGYFYPIFPFDKEVSQGRLPFLNICLELWISGSLVWITGSLNLLISGSRTLDLWISVSQTLDLFISVSRNLDLWISGLDQWISNSGSLDLWISGSLDDLWISDSGSLDLWISESRTLDARI